MRGNTFAEEIAGRAAARVEVLPGQAGAIQAVDGMAWQVRMHIIEANLAAITDQPMREFLPPLTLSHRKNRQERKSELLSGIAAMGHDIVKKNWADAIITTAKSVVSAAASAYGNSPLRAALQSWPATTPIAAKGANNVPAETGDGEDDDEDPFGHGGALDEREEESARSAHEANPTDYHVNTLVLGSGVVHHTLVLGSGVVHHTHETWLMRGITFCGKCGAWATTAPRLLTKE